MRNSLILVFCFFTSFVLISCVTTSENTNDVPVTSEKIVEDNTKDGSSDPGQNTEKSGIIYSSRELADGPLLLGSKEHLTGPVSEFSILYTIYFPLSGILIDDNEYRISKGTRWQVVSDKLVQDVFFERALLSEDDEGRSWWYFKVEGDGFEREYEFLIDKEWKLLEMRYSLDGQIKSYVPSVDEVNNLSNGSINYEDFKVGREDVDTNLGLYSADHILVDSTELWMSSKVEGNFVKSLLKENDLVILTASIIEEKDGYVTLFNSY